MARIRTIKPEFFKSRTVARLNDFQKLLFIGLWTYVDDYGNGVNDPRLVRAELYPLCDNVLVSDVSIAMVMIESEGLIEFYEVDGTSYFRLTSWDEHQTLSRKSKPKHPFGPEERKTPAQIRSMRMACNTHAIAREEREQGTGNREREQVAANATRMPVARASVSTKQDPLWDALMYVCRIDTAKITKSARGAYNRAVKELKEVGATPESIAHAAMAYRLAYGDVALTPSALAKHYAGAEGVATQPKVSKKDLEIAQWVNDTDS